MHIAFCLFDEFNGRPKGSIGSSLIRGHWLLSKWKEAELFKIGKKYQAIIFQKVYWQHMLELFDGIKILDLCDLDFFQSPIKLVAMSKYLDAITCSTSALADLVSKYIKHVSKYIPIVYIPDRVNFDELPSPKREQSEKLREICWYGYYHNACDILPQVLPTLYKLKIRLKIISNYSFTPYQNYGVEIINVKWETNSCWSEIQASDAVLNFQPKSIFRFKYKSNNKTIIAQALGMPVIKTFEDIERLATKKAREEEVKRGLEEVRKNYDIRFSIQQYKELIDSLFKAKR